MRVLPRVFRLSSLRRGFSLIELSVVVAIISVVAVLGLEVASNFVVRTANDVSRERLIVVDEAIANFFRVYGRLPCPANKTLAPDNNAYGMEDCSIPNIPTTTIGGGLVAGAVPIRALNIPMSYGLDGFSSKLNYVVTRNLTQAGGDKPAPTQIARFGTATTIPNDANDGIAGIEIRAGILDDACGVGCQKVAEPNAPVTPGAAYILFSSGADQRGAVSERGTPLRACITPPNDRRVDTQNCVFGGSTVGMIASGQAIPANVFYDNRYNAGLNMSSYFDDIAIWRTKGRL